MDKYSEFKQIEKRLVEINKEKKELSELKKLLDQDNEKIDQFKNRGKNITGIRQVS